MSDSRPTRKEMFRWIGWFFFFNTLLAFSIIFYYHHVIPDFNAIPGESAGYMVLGWTFFVLGFFTQCAILMYAIGAICLVIGAIWPRRYLIYPVAILFSTLALFGLVADAVTYNLYYQHYASVGWAIFKAKAFGDVLVLGTPEKIIIVCLPLFFILLEYAIAWIIWRVIRKNKNTTHGYVAAGLVCSTVLFTYGLMAGAVTFNHKHWMATPARHVVLKAARVTPYFNDVYNLFIPGDTSVQTVYTAQGPVKLQVNEQDRPLNYPIKPLQCTTPKKPMNVLIIGIDTWRYTAMNPKVTPNIYRFAQQAIQFQDHYSGGNCTRPGIFTLFYGLPSNYWKAFLSQHKRPVLIDQLMDDGYQMGIFTSAPLTFPAFNQSVFEGIKGLVVKISGKSSIVRDRKITVEFKKFLDNRKSNKPFFSFLFYDAVHNYCEHQLPPKKPFKPYIKSCDRVTLTVNTPRLPYLNRYKNAVYFDDQEVAQDLAQLKKRGLLKNTIVIITADHGEQINDEGKNIWVHASAYTKYQLHVPFIVYWPGKQPRAVNYFTSHYDMAPTLMKNALACKAPFADYSTGESLFIKGNRPYLIAGSYGDYAVVEPGKQSTRIYPNGDYQIDNMQGMPIAGARLNVKQMRAVYQVLNQFFYASAKSPVS